VFDFDTNQVGFATKGTGGSATGSALGANSTLVVGGSNANVVTSDALSFTSANTIWFYSLGSMLAGIFLFF
jgi:hypothetical protein